MLIDTRDFQTTARLSPLGPPRTGLAENARAASRAGAMADRSVSEFFNLRNAYGDYLDTVADATGKRFDNPMDALAVPLFGVASPGADRRARAKAVRKLDEDLKALHDKDPSFEVRSQADLEADITAEAGRRAGEQASVAARQTKLGAVGEFLGAAAVALTDPPIAGSLGLGAPLSAGVVRTAILEALVGGTSEALVQPQIQLYRRELGLEFGLKQAAGNVAIAAGGGLLFGASFKLAGMGFKKMLRIAGDVKAVRTQAHKDAEAVLRRQMEIADDAPPSAEATAGRPAAKAADAQRQHVRDFDAAVTEAREARLPTEDQIPDKLATVARGAEKAELEARARKTGRPTAKARKKAPEPVRELAADLPEPARVVREGEAKGEPSPLTDLLDRLRGKTKGPGQPMGLVRFIREQGGLLTTGEGTAEVRALGITARTHPTLINRNGTPLDEIGDRAFQAGFFRERPDFDEILEALDEEVNRGRPRVRGQDMEAVFEQEAIDAFEVALDRAGIDLDLPDAEIERLMDVHFRGADELLSPGGEDVARVLDPRQREARAAEDAFELRSADENEIAAAQEAEFIRQLEETPDMDVAVGIERDPDTGELVTVTRPAREVLEDLDADDAFVREIGDCAGI